MHMQHCSMCRWTENHPILWYYKVLEIAISFPITSASYWSRAAPTTQQIVRFHIRISGAIEIKYPSNERTSFLIDILLCVSSGLSSSPISRCSVIEFQVIRSYSYADSHILSVPRSPLAAQRHSSVVRNKQSAPIPLYRRSATYIRQRKDRATGTREKVYSAHGTTMEHNIGWFLSGAAGAMVRMVRRTYDAGIVCLSCSYTAAV